MARSQDRIGIYAVFQPDTELTASEVLDGKTAPERLPKAAAVADVEPCPRQPEEQDARRRLSQRPAAVRLRMVDDIPFQDKT